MKQRTVDIFKAMMAAMAEGYGVTPEQIKSCFAVSEPMETKLNSAIQDSSDFLQRITIMPVTDRKGQAVRVNVSQPLAKRTNVSNKDRAATDMSGPDGAEYVCKLTEFDVAMGYDLLDAWARFPDFAQRYMTAVYRRIALDRMMIGFHGTSAAAETNSTTNSNLEDVNIGWLKLLETHAAENFYKESTEGTGKITIGAAGDYKNLDQLTYGIYNMIPTANRSGGEVAIVGRQLVANDMGKALAKHAQTPTEKGQVMVLDKAYGGLPAIVVPGFPDKGLLVTDTENLHLYYQESGMRRQTKDNPRRNRVEDFISSNEAYMLGDFSGAAAIDASNVEFKES
ncbi:phage major capsid protein, P2 family [Endozoicomonas sp. GU-1]|uniref:phage major capsid protein, P2 family n=1 Tax=Endozoicomonas sp. GU-1 TaxID=3009078 RepID=UPI0022B2FDCC|nr:phage major capsid protein, P2 family [Endozoicomonas sp. GU-1]WBA86516.1 phage major capsid protein, P2 family [Endozoicomonas sp. GU-1]